MSAKPNLRVVAPADQSAPSTEYEWQHRQRIARKDWAAIHIGGDRSAPLSIIDRIVRPWR